MTDRTILCIRRSSIAAISVLAALLLVPATQAQVRVPAESEAPANLKHWVPASLAFTNGELREVLFTPEERAHIETWLRTPEVRETPEDPSIRDKRADPAECDVLLVTSSGIESADVSLALERGSVAFTGTVISMETGLYRARLATLVSVEVERWLKAPKAARVHTIVHFIHGDSQATIGGRSYCHQAAGRNDRLAVGRRVVLATSNVLEEDPLLVLPYESELFFETAQRGVSAGGPVDGPPPSDWMRFEKWVLRLAEETGG